MYTRLITTFLALILAISSAFARAPQNINEFRGRFEVATPIRLVRLFCGEVETETFREGEQEIVFLFRGAVDDVVDLTMAESEGALGAAFLRAKLFTPSGIELGVFNGTTLAAYTLPEAGPYMVRVTAGQPGKFHLGLSCRPPKGSAAELVLGQQVVGEISGPARLAYAVFSGLAGEVLDLSLVSTGGFASSTPRGTLFSPSGASLGAFDADSLTTVSLAESGTHLVRLQSNSLNGSGMYALGLFAPPPVGTPIPLPPCAPPLLRSIATSGSVDYFSFDGAIDDIVEVSLVTTAGFSESVPQFRLFSPTGADLGTFSADSLTPFQLAEAGTYLVAVRPDTLVDTGSYAIGLSCRPPLGAGTPIADGGMVSTTLVSAGEVDYYTFAGTIGQTADITFTDDSGFPSSTPQMRVFAPSNLDLGAFNADNFDTIPIALEETGTYAIRVTANTLAGTGDYTIALNILPAPFAAVHLGATSLSQSSISAPGEVDLFSFDGAVNEVIELTLTQSGFPGGVTARAMLFAPGGMLIATFNANSLNEFALADTGRHTVELQASNGLSTGDYNLGLERRRPMEPLAPPLVCGQLYSDSIEYSGELDYFTFEGSVDDQIQLTQAQSGFPGGTFAVATLYSPSGVSLGAQTGNTINAYTLPEAGRYAVRVHTNNLVSTGDYSIGLECVVPLGPVVSNLVCGDLIADSISARGEVDYFSFEGSVDDQIQLTQAQSGFPGGTFAVATLYSPSGVSLGAQTGNTINAYTLPEAGTYAVRVHTNNLVSTGDYSIGLECVVPLGPVVSNLVCGDLIADSISARGEVDYFTFEGSVDDQIQLTQAQSGFPGGTFAVATLYSPSGVSLGAQTGNTINAYTLPETGTYAVRVHTNNLVSTGDYSIGLECVVPLGPVVSNLVCGDLIADSISARGEVDYFSFEGSVDDQIQLTQAQSGFPGGTFAVATLYSPSGVSLGAQTGNTINAYTLPETGRYAVRVYTNNLVSTGDYSIGLECVVPLGPVVSNLVCGDLIADSISARGEVDYFSFEGSVDDQIQLTQAQSGFPGGTFAVATLYSPSGVSLGAQTGNTIQAYTLPEAGTYAVRVHTNNLVSTGDYSIGLECVVPLGPVVSNLVCGDLIADSISARGEVDYFSFEGSVDDQIQLTQAQSGFPGGTFAVATLYSPSGVSLGAQTGNTINAYTLPETGRYAVRVYTNNLVSTGDYSIGLECVVPLGPVVSNLVCGDLIADSISARGEVDYFSFEGSVDDQIQLTQAQSGFPGGTFAVATLYSPSGVSLGAQTGNTIQAYTLPEAGTYAVRVHTNNLVSTGNYDIGLVCP